MRGAFETYYMRPEYADNWFHWLFHFSRGNLSRTYIMRICGASLVIAFYPVD
jgi:hypothetical protein